MGWDGVWRLTEPPMTGEQVGQIQRRALRAFGSYAIPLGVGENNIYDGTVKLRSCGRSANRISLIRHAHLVNRGREPAKIALGLLKLTVPC